MLIDIAINHKARPEPFYGQWHYCACFHIAEAHALRQLDHASIDSILTMRRAWQNRSINFGGSWHHRSRTITDHIKEDLHRICDFLLADPTPRKLKTYSDHLYVYCNDLEFCRRMCSIGTADLIQVTQVQLSGTPGSVVLKSARHQFRTYLRDRRLDERTASALKHFLANQTDMRLSPGVSQWIADSRLATQSHFFVDHNSRSTLMMIQMISPDVIRKTMPIESAK